MTVVVPHAWTAGDDATSTSLQTSTDALRQLQGYAPASGALDYAVLLQIVTQSLNTSTWTAITFTSEGVDSASGHSTSTNTSRYTAVHTGWYQVNAGVSFALNATGSRAIRFAVNGTAVQGRHISPATAATVASDLSLSKRIFLTAGDYLEIQGWQNSGGALSTAYTSPEQGSFMDLKWEHA